MKESYSAISRYKHDQSNGKLNIEYVRNYETETNSIQIIQAKVENDHNKMNEFIHDTFDFDICKNIYYNIFKFVAYLNGNKSNNW